MRDIVEAIGERKATKSEEAVARLRQAILRGEIAPGEWLRQEDLAARFGISPTPVREALRQLQSEGLVEHIPRRGVKVVAYTLNSAREYYDLRELLEPYTLRLAAERMSAAELDDLRALVEQAEAQLAAGAMTELTDLNWRFHEELLRLCGSRLAADVLARVRRSFALDTLLMIPERAAASVREHRLVADALARGDVEAAAEEMRANIANAREAMLARLPSLGTKSQPIFEE